MITKSVRSDHAWYASLLAGMFLQRRGAPAARSSNLAAYANYLVSRAIKRHAQSEGRDSLTRHTPLIDARTGSTAVDFVGMQPCGKHLPVAMIGGRSTLGIPEAHRGGMASANKGGGARRFSCIRSHRVTRRRSPNA